MTREKLTGDQATNPISPTDSSPELVRRRAALTRQAPPAQANRPADHTHSSYSDIPDEQLVQLLKRTLLGVMEARGNETTKPELIASLETQIDSLTVELITAANKLQPESEVCLSF